MDRDGAGRGRSTRRPLIIGVAAACLLVVVIVAIAVPLSQRRDVEDFKRTFMGRCNKFDGYDCNKIWPAFEQAYVGRNSCAVPMDAYDLFVALATFSPVCNKMMFWSKTKDIVHDYTKKNKACYETLEDTLLGSVVNDLTWCGKEGSKETFTTGCPEWNTCQNNPVRSFWNRASTAFADAACGNVTVMLNGSIDTPFHPTSIFATIEVPRFTSAKVKSLNVVLITQSNLGTCTNKSLKDLQKQLAPGIIYNCKEVAQTQIKQCSSDPETCKKCW